MGIAETVRAMSAFARSNADRVDRMASAAIAYIAARASTGDTECVVLREDMAVDDDPISLGDAREVARAIMMEGFRVSPSVVKGAFHVSWGDNVDEWWDGAL